jgi:predicted methyltransferase
MAKRKVDGKTMSLIIKDYMDGMEKVIKKNIDTFESAMMSYAKKRSTDYAWDEQIVTNFKVKTAHFFKLPIPIAQTDDQIEMSEKQQELIEFAKSSGWSSKIWESDIELEIYIRGVAKKELGK